MIAAAAENAALPDRVGGVIAMNMIGHLPPGRRQGLWRRIGKRLAPKAPLVVNVQPPTEPVAVPETTFATVRVGRYVYQGSGAAQPAGPHAVTWRMRYRVLDEAGRVVRETTADYRWHVLSHATMVAELTAAGFDADIGPLDVVRAVIRTVR